MCAQKSSSFCCHFCLWPHSSTLLGILYLALLSIYPLSHALWWGDNFQEVVGWTMMRALPWSIYVVILLINYAFPHYYCVSQPLAFETMRWFCLTIIKTATIFCKKMTNRVDSFGRNHFTTFIPKRVLFCFRCNFRSLWKERKEKNYGGIWTLKFSSICRFNFFIFKGREIHGAFPCDHEDMCRGHRLW